MKRSLAQLVEPPRAGTQVPASPEELLDLLQQQVQCGALRALDRAFAAFVLEQAPQAPASVILAAALTSFQLGRGHACLDLQALLDEPHSLLGGTGKDGQTQRLGDLLAALSLQDWRQALADCVLVEDHDQQPPSPERPLVLAGQRLYLRRYWNYEQSIAASLAQRLAQRLAQPQLAPPKLAEDLARLFPEPCVVDGQRQTDWQKVACAIAARGHFSVITGGPGTGKTTSVVRLLGLLQTPAVAAGRPLRIRLAAPTGKAAARLSESIGQAINQLQVSEAVRQAIPAEVSTLHRLLGSRPDSRHFVHHPGNPLALDVLVVDEASMIDLEMMACLLAALPLSARLIMLGDKDQLASVDAGAVLGDLCGNAEQGGYSEATRAWLSEVSGESLAAEGLQFAAGQGDPLAQQTVMLRHSRRFAADRGIGQLARLVNRQQAREARQLLDAQPQQLSGLKLSDGQSAVLNRLLVDGHSPAAPGYRHYLELLHGQRPDPQLPWDSPHWNSWAAAVLRAFDAFRVLCALRSDRWGVDGLNQRIAGELRRLGLIDSEQGWYEGRPVLVTRNDYSLGLMNGDIGIALQLPAADAPGQTRLRVAFPRNDGSGAVRFVLPSRLNEVETVFAMTVHKSQGSEFRHTALVLPDAASPVLTKELLYTAITRAREHFSLIETRSGVFETAIGKQVARSSGLPQWLREQCR